MVFMATAQYFFLEYLVKRKTSWQRVGVIGVCLACVLMLRPNMIGVWIGYTLIILILLLKNKEYASIGKYALWMLSGLAVGMLPILIWFAAAGSLGDFADCLWRFNFTYAGRNEASDIVGAFRFYFLDTRRYFQLAEGAMALIAVYYIIQKRQIRVGVRRDFVCFCGYGISDLFSGQYIWALWYGGHSGFCGDDLY
mgnify:CR=1 FL=1